MSSPDETVTLTAQCLCKSHTFSTTVPLSSLPLSASVCHCTSCRHTTGSLHAMDIDWPRGDPSSTASIYSSGLRVFDFTPKVKVLFCPTCGTTMFFSFRYDGPDGEVGTGVLTGTLTLSNVPGDLSQAVRITDHIFVGDTVDGGASVWFRRPNGDGHVPKRFTGGKGAGCKLSEEVGDDWPSPVPTPSSERCAVEVPIRCKCGGVNFLLRPDFSSVSGKDVPWFVDPGSKKLLASFDACDSCRIATGTDVVYWTFTLLRHIYFPSSSSSQSTTPTETLPPTTPELKSAVTSKDHHDPRLGTLSLYESSPGVQRYFCGTCSATVFFACDARPDMVDIAVGLLGSETGARAEDVLSWALGGDMTWRGDVVGTWREGLITAMERGAEEFRLQRGLPWNFRRRGREEEKKRREEKRKREEEEKKIQE